MHLLGDRRDISIIGIALLVATMGCGERAEHRTREASAVAASEARRREALTMAEAHRAVIDWDRALCVEGQYRESPILRLELERLWLTGRPILFLGVLRDVSSKSQDTYAVLVDRTPLLLDIDFTTRLELHLDAPKDLLDALLAGHPNLLSGPGIDAGVAVVAKVSRIDAASDIGADLESVETRSGVGELLDIRFVGDTYSWSNQAARD